MRQFHSFCNIVLVYFLTVIPLKKIKKIKIKTLNDVNVFVLQDSII